MYKNYRLYSVGVAFEMYCLLAFYRSWNFLKTLESHSKLPSYDHIKVLMSIFHYGNLNI